MQSAFDLLGAKSRKQNQHILFIYKGSTTLLGKVRDVSAVSTAILNIHRPLASFWVVYDKSCSAVTGSVLFEPCSLLALKRNMLLFSQSATMANQLFVILLFGFLSRLLEAEINVFLEDKTANKFLSRTRRANSPFEEFKKGNIERECYEERCSKEEAREAFEDQALTEEFWNKYFDGDQCESNPCHYGGTCQDGIGKYTCMCLNGYHGVNCESVIQKYCKLNNGDCDHFCTLVENTVVCSCADGYILGEDGTSCVATGSFPCGQNIVNKKAPKKKREASSFGDMGDTGHDNEETELTYDDSLSVQNFTSDQNFTTQHPSLHFKGEVLLNNSKSKTELDGLNMRIVGGHDCAPGECPWQALLINEEDDGFCGGTVLNEFFVLTAAHCINQTKSIRVILGEVDVASRERTGTLFAVEKIFIHHRFVLKTYDYDIALIKLKRPIQFSENITAACLPTQDFANQILMAQEVGMVSGFGRIHEKGRQSTKLKVVNLPYIDRNTCKLSSNFAVTENMFCAGYDTVAKDACQGDSGGPHVTAYRNTYFVTGIVSWGEGCARTGKYGVYTKVSKFIVWIKRIMLRARQDNSARRGQL
ncbi:coagulation factor X-like [Paroedura picta]|uniref:coagulation factor X-like n=1 Tax=Paroedura picta TaxID=143630 RepID=UPI004055C126